MKTPEEIKRGLECCAQIDCGRVRCSYYSLGGGSKCIPAMASDALAYISQLEAKLAEYEKPLKPLTLAEAKAMVGVWIEDDGCCWGIDEPQPALWCGRVNGHFHRFIDKHYDDTAEFVYFDEVEYGETWRCWSRRPTDEERRAAAWQTT